MGDPVETRLAQGFPSSFSEDSLEADGGGGRLFLSATQHNARAKLHDKVRTVGLRQLPKALLQVGGFPVAL